MEAGVIRRLSSQWQDAVLVCGKCTKKLGGGFGKKDGASLAKALRKLLGLRTGRKATLGIVETKCLGVCPKHAVVVARAGEWLVVPVGTSVGQVAVTLDLPRHSRESRNPSSELSTPTTRAASTRDGFPLSRE